MIITSKFSEELPDPTEGGYAILVDKPLNWTSFDVVNKIKWLLRTKYGLRKLKVGHAGTLDPLATGLLIVCVGRHTKQIDTFQGLSKGYSGTMQLGATTPSYDLETEIDERFDLTGISEEVIRQRASEMIGETDQLPPIFSAKKIDGKKAYDLARAGKPVEMRRNRITIMDFKIPSIELPNLTFDIRCSKGTYIRSMAYDLGFALKCGGHLTSLRRTFIGEYSVDDAFEIPTLESKIGTP